MARSTGILGVCFSCKQIEKIYARDLCRPCHKTFSAAGTIDSVRVANADVRADARMRLVEYNALRAAGKSLKEIAAHWGCALQTVKNFGQKARDAGLKVF